MPKIWQVFAHVVTPDYNYWNPVKGTESDTVKGARELGKEKAFELWPNDEVRRVIFLSRCKVMKRSPAQLAKE